MKVTVISIVVNTLETVPKVIEKRLEELEIRGRTGIIETNNIVKSAIILRKVLAISRDLLSLKLQWKTPSLAGVKIWKE